MSKLSHKFRFLDLSDYGRPFAKRIVHNIQHTQLTPIHVTIAFVLAGLAALFCILKGFYLAALFLLILKSILDAADGELARAKKTPSHVGRYLDSICDILLNLMLLLTIGQITNGSLIATLTAFFAMQLQGTLYNFYYAILRNKCNGDTTSRIFESGAPKALPGEKQHHVNLLFRIYIVCYGTFDKIIYWLDGNAAKGEKLPHWLMTSVSSFGLGFQLLLIGLMLPLGFAHYIVPFFIANSLLVLVFIALRRMSSTLHATPKANLKSQFNYGSSTKETIKSR